MTQEQHGSAARQASGRWMTVSVLGVLLMLAAPFWVFLTPPTAEDWTIRMSMAGPHTYEILRSLTLYSGSFLVALSILMLAGKVARWYLWIIVLLASIAAIVGTVPPVQEWLGLSPAIPEWYPWRGP